MENDKRIEVMDECIKEIQGGLSKVLKPAYESENLNELFAALAKSQLEMEVAKTENSNPFFKSKYANLTEIVKASRPYLARNGLCVIQRILPNGNDTIYIATRLAHSSGQWIESRMPITPQKQDIQSIGSYISYLRRYTYAAIVGVVSSDEDDDGENAMSRDQSPQAISSKETKEIENLLSQLDSSEKEKVLKWCQVKNVKEINKTKFDAVVKNLNIKLQSKE